MNDFSYLTAKDLVLYEDLLASKLSRFFCFSSGNLYFPRNTPADMVNENDEYTSMYQSSDNKLFLPLIHKDKLLGIFIAQNVDSSEYMSIKPKLTEITSLCLENLLMYKNKQSDPLTGLYNRHYFLSLLQLQIQRIRESFLKRCVDDYNLSDYSAHFGLIVLNVDDMCRINNRLGYQFGDIVLSNIASTLTKQVPPQASLFRLETDNFAILLPETNLSKCNQLAENLREKVAEIAHNYSPTGETFKITSSLATIHYPRDFAVNHFNQDEYEQAFFLVEQAYQSISAAKQRGKNLVQPFSEILKKVGIVTQNLTPNRIQVNIGSKFQAAAGQRFTVISGRGETEERALKGEIILVDIYDEESTAEILYHNDPGSNLEPGDRIVYSDQKHSIRHSFPEPGDVIPSWQNSREILPLEDFIKYWHSHCGQTAQFCMILCRVNVNDEPESDKEQSTEPPGIYSELYRALKSYLPSEGRIGEYSTNSLIIYLPATDLEQAEKTAKGIYEQVHIDNQSSLTLGIAYYPCYHFNRTDMLINCRKAFEHALLLPPPQIAFFNSTSLTISADRHFTHEDLSNAIQEYKTALLLDSQNHTARNSLGICFAKLGQLNSAFREFKQIADQDPDNHLVLYNLGYTYLKLDYNTEAKQCFQKCIEQSNLLDSQEFVPEHIFSLLRLGEIEEKNLDPEQAKSFYMQALDKKHGSKYAYRFLGNLEYKQGNRESAKSHFQQALVQNPRDAEAMHLLAKIYLEQGEDPEVAESLAQKSIELRPQVNNYRKLLLKALQHQDKNQEARILEKSINTTSNPTTFPLLT